MTLLSLQRQAPVAPGVAECRLLLGHPDATQLGAAITRLGTICHGAPLPPAEWTGRSRP